MVQKIHINSGRLGHLVSPSGTSNAPAGLGPSFNLQGMNILLWSYLPFADYVIVRYDLYLQINLTIMIRTAGMGTCPENQVIMLPTLSSPVIFTGGDVSSMGLLPDTQNRGLRMRRECREHFPHHQIQRKLLVSDPGMRHARAVMHVGIAKLR